MEQYSEQYSETITTIFAVADEESGRPARRRNPSRVGELAEAAFLYKAAGLDFGVAKPWNSERYDFIIDSGARLWRVQLKCTEVLRARGYDVQPIYNVYGKGKMVYTAEDIDALAVHITPLDVWYVLPVEDFAPPQEPPLLPQQRLQARPLRTLPRSLAPPPPMTQEPVSVRAGDSRVAQPSLAFLLSRVPRSSSAWAGIFFPG